MLSFSTRPQKPLHLYVLLAVGVAVSICGASQLDRNLFWRGTAIAGGLAALASLLELLKGNICPVGFEAVPMCYISLASA